MPHHAVLGPLRKSGAPFCSQGLPRRLFATALEACRQGGILSACLILLGCPATFSLTVPDGESVLPPGVTAYRGGYGFQTEFALVRLDGRSYSRGGPSVITLDLMISNISGGDVLVSIDGGGVRMTGCEESEVETSVSMPGQEDFDGAVLASGDRSLVLVSFRLAGDCLAKSRGRGFTFAADLGGIALETRERSVPLPSFPFRT